MEFYAQSDGFPHFELVQKMHKFVLAVIHSFAEYFLYAVVSFNGLVEKVQPSGLL